MKQLISRSIRAKLVFILSISALIAILLFSIAVFAYTFSAKKKEGIDSLSQLTNIISHNLVASVEFDDNASATNILKTFQFNSDIEGALLFNKGGELFSSYLKTGEDQASLISMTHGVNTSNDIHKPFEYIDASHIITGRPVISAGETIGYLTIVANTDSLRRIITDQLIVQLVVSLIAFVAIFLLALRLESMFTSPIFELKRMMEYVTANKTYDVHIESKSTDEFKALHEGFNSMIDHINEQTRELNKQREFVTTLLDSQEQIVITTNDSRVLSGNASFKKFFKLNSVHDFGNECLSSKFSVDAPEGYLQASMCGKTWTDYVLNTPGTYHKAMICSDDEAYIFSVNAAKLPFEEDSAVVKAVVLTNITALVRQQEELSRKTEELEEANHKAEVANEAVHSSIKYASRIQRAILPPDDFFNSVVPEHFVLWEPRDVVSGDIYGCKPWGDGSLILLGDCTGHGVPGAFMTMLSAGALERAISETSPGDVKGLVQAMHRTLQHTLNQDSEHGHSDDGIEMGVCYLNADKSKMVFAGARFDLYILEDGAVKIIKGSKSGMGYRGIPVDQQFETREIIPDKNMIFYLASDGVVDQIGENTGWGVGRKRMMQWILESGNLPLADQKSHIYNSFLAYQGSAKRRDDVSIIGFKI